MRKQNKVSVLDTYILDIQHKLFQYREQYAFHPDLTNQEGSRSFHQHQLDKEEKEIVESIRHKTVVSNRNNITRTEAYLSFFLNYPDIHWAFLAHAVSRNAGWNMTDLKGEMLPRLLHPLEVKYFFQMLERSNWLIFQDAYPQLQLYAESRKQNRPLFHLLPYFQISTFMQAIWGWYWEHRTQIKAEHASKLISYALIINEQNYIEQRVIQDPFYQKHVLKRFTFLLQSFLHFNHVYFPYAKDHYTGEQGSRIHQLRKSLMSELSLAGAIIRDFADINERIRVGKTLYSILFELGMVSVDIQTWHLASIHTGSRADYWPHIYTPQKEEADQRTEVYQFHLKQQNLHQKSSPIYSPHLESAWPDQRHSVAEQGDWYKGHLIHSWFSLEKGLPYDLTKECVFALNRIEAAIVAKEALESSK